MTPEKIVLKKKAHSSNGQQISWNIYGHLRRNDRRLIVSSRRANIPKTRNSRKGQARLNYLKIEFLLWLYMFTDNRIILTTLYVSRVKIELTLEQLRASPNLAINGRWKYRNTGNTFQQFLLSFFPLSSFPHVGGEIFTLSESKSLFIL